MTRLSVALFFIFFVATNPILAQVSPDCNNAVPICNNTPINGGTDGFGIDDFNGASVTGCIALANGPIESNSAWYRFRTGESGQLGINIGFDVSEDWDFALYRAADCSNLGEPVRCNYFDNSDDNTFTGFGEDPTGVDNFQYDDWLDVAAGEDYYLFINNFSNNNSGFSIQFSGDVFVDFPNTALDCSIISNLLGPPIAACENDTITLNATTIGAISYEWYLDIGNGYQQIPAENGENLNVAVSGMYRVLVVVPSGENIISEVQVSFSPSPTTDPLGDELMCLDGTAFDLSQKNGEALGNQSEDEFRVSYYGSIADATNGTNILDNNYIPTEPSQTIFARTTSIANTNCFDVSESFEINTVAVPELDFPTSVFICEDTPVATVGQRIPNPDYSYSWDSGQVSSQITVTTEGTYTLSVTNVQGAVSCVSVRSVAVTFSSPPVITDIDVLYDDDSNMVTVFTQEDGDFEYQLDDNSPQSAPVFRDILPGLHSITVNDRNGCGADTQEVVIVGFPKFFTPNGDGINDLWTVGGMSVLDNPVVHIYDRFGKLLFQMDENSPGWNGMSNGKLMPASDYWFKLSYTDQDGQLATAKFINNHFSIKR
jgi:gliding motility-associated-like protein